MPLEIRELVIKAKVNEGSQSQGSNQGTATGSSSAPDQSTIIAACVEQVLAIIKEKSER